MNKKRSKIIPFLMNLIMPGWGYIYLGKLKSAISLMFFITSLILLIPIIIKKPSISVEKVFFSIIIIYFTLEALLLVDVIEITKGESEFKMRWFNFSPFYFLFLLLFFIPIFIFYNFYVSNFLRVCLVGDLSMFPVLTRGDIILVEKKKPLSSFYMKGELVAVKDENGCSVLRVIATPDDEVMLRGKRLFLNGDEVQRVSLGNVIFDENFYKDEIEASNLYGYEERIGDKKYDIFFREDVEDKDNEHFSLEKEEYFLLADNRSTFYSNDSRKKGIFYEREILGIPLKVIFNSKILKEKLHIKRLGIKLN